MQEVKKFQKKFQKKQQKQSVTPSAICALLQEPYTEAAWQGWSG
jgi:hypothetical protein